MVNEYSSKWFEVFLKNKVDNLDKEVDFLCRYLPLHNYRKILDVCCGVGRHSNNLATYGYEVIGIDKDIMAIEYAKKQSEEKVAYYQYDMRYLENLKLEVDAIISMWHSFGYFSEEVNEDIIRQVSEILSIGGRFILDIYNKDFFNKNIGIRQFKKGDILITEKIKKVGSRFNVKLTYSNNDEVDEFDWQLYSIEEILQLCKYYNLDSIAKCVGWHNAIKIDGDTPRMQLVFQKSL